MADEKASGFANNSTMADGVPGNTNSVITVDQTKTYSGVGSSQQ